MAENIYRPNPYPVKAVQWDGTYDGFLHIREIFPEIVDCSFVENKRVHAVIKQPDPTREDGYRMYSFVLLPSQWLIYYVALNTYGKHSEDAFCVLYKPMGSQ